MFPFKSLMAYGILSPLALGMVVLVMKYSPSMHQTQGVTHMTDEVPLGHYSFRLIDTSGQRVTHEDFLGRVRLIFFGFTHCPDICPLGLTKMNEVLDLLGNDRQKVAPIFITVDPERDTPDIMKMFLKSFPKDFIGLTGSKAEISATVASYKAYVHKQPADSTGDYTVGHSSFIYIMDPKGAYSTHVMLDTDAETIVAQIRKNIS